MSEPIRCEHGNIGTQTPNGIWCDCRPAASAGADPEPASRAEDRFRHALQTTVAEAMPNLARSLEAAFDEVMAEARAQGGPSLDALKRALFDEYRTPHYGLGEHEARARAIFQAPRLAARLGEPAPRPEEDQ